VIERPVEEVFDFVADERNEPRFNPRMLRAEKISPGPIGVGTRFSAEMATGGRRTLMTTEFTAFERPHRLALITCMSWMEIRGSLAFEPIPGGTRLRWHWDVRPRGVLRLVGPVIGRIGRRQERTIWVNLKRLLETREGAEGAATST
jgi:Polyketide cyclase / dehydrase and lipid transport